MSKQPRNGTSKHRDRKHWGASLADLAIGAVVNWNWQGGTRAMVVGINGGKVTLECPGVYPNPTVYPGSLQLLAKAPVGAPPPAESELDESQGESIAIVRKNPYIDAPETAETDGAA